MNVKSVILYATTDCNHHCRHCFLTHHSTWNESDLARVTSILCKHCRVTINGAENLLHPGFLEAYRIAGQQYVFSNGLVFLGKQRDALIDRMKKSGVMTVRLSNHFQAATTLNAVPVDIVERITAILQKEGINVEYNSTVTSENYSRLEENCNRAHQLGVHRIKFFPLMQLGSALSMGKSMSLTYGQLDHFYNILKGLRAVYPVSELDLRISGDLSKLSEKFSCPFGKGMFTITPDYQVYGCVYSIGVLPPVGYMKSDGMIIVTNNIEHDGKTCLINCSP